MQIRIFNRRRITQGGLMALAAISAWPVFGQGGGSGAAFADAVSAIALARSQSEQGVALLKRYKPDDVEGRALYAQAKASFDGVISGLQAGIEETGSTRPTAALQAQLKIAVDRATAFSQHVDIALRQALPSGSKSTWMEMLLSHPDKLLTALVNGGLAISAAAYGASQERRKQLSDRLEQERWRNFSDIPPAA